MAMFKKRRQTASPASHTPPPWTPEVDMATARPAVFALANVPGSTDSQLRAAITRFGALSERPTDPSQMMHLMSTDPQATFLQRPWAWLAAVMREASEANDHHLTAAALSWACYWTINLVPRGDLGVFIDLGLDPIKPPIQAEILALGLDSVHQLAHDFVVIGDPPSPITAGWLAEHAPSMLNG